MKVIENPGYVTLRSQQMIGYIMSSKVWNRKVMNRRRYGNDYVNK